MQRLILNYCLVSLILLTVLVSQSSFAQTNKADYTAQVAALKASFENENPEALKAHVSPELAFGHYPTSATPTILGQFFSGQMKIRSLEMGETKKGEALIKYDIYGLGKRESRLLFDDDGKIKRIELIDNIIKLQQEMQKEMASQVQAPTPGALAEKYPFSKVEFPSKDGHLITGNIYDIGTDKPVILLCHQANYNKYEYAGIAPKLNQMGYNVMAIDQRSGGDFAGKNNETFHRAKAKGLSTEFLDAQQDIEAAVAYLSEKYGKMITIWGSSYSSSLVLFVAASNDHVNASISFSPGDYFGEKKATLSSVLGSLDKPFFITSSKEEAGQRVSALLTGLKLTDQQIQFIPEGNGYHGSRALWQGQKGGEEYWEAVTEFLSRIYPQ